MRRISKPISFGGVAVCAMLAVGAHANLIVNGDFSAGDTGFVSFYTYVAPTTSPGTCSGGLYTITAATAVGSASCWGGGWSVPTGGAGDPAGNVLLANGASGLNGVPGQASLWSQSVDVAADTTYLFSFYVVDVDGSPYADITPTINSVSQPAFSATQNWQEDSVTWNSGSSTSALLSLFDADTTEGNNDFAITDISLTAESPAATVPEPASVALVGAALLGLGAARRVRARK